MPVNAKAVVDIEVNDKQFKEFQTSFDKYVKLLQRTPAAWKAVSAEQKVLVQSIMQGTAALMAQNSVMHKNALAAHDVRKASESSAFHWDKMKDRAKKFGDYVLHAHEHIMKWAGIVGGVMTGMGAASGWGLYGLGQWVRGGSIAGSRVNMATHELRAVKGLIGDPYGIDVEGIAKMVATAQGNPASNEYRAIKSFTGRNPENLQGTGKVTEVLLGLIERMERGDKPARIAAMSGGAYNEGDLNSLWNNRDAIRAAAAKAPAEAERVKVPAKTEQAWNDFIAHLQNGGEILKKILVVGLEPFLKMIEKHSGKWLKQFEDFMSNPATQKFLEEMPDKLEHWVTEIVDQLEKFAKKLGWIKKSADEQKAEDDAEKAKADRIHLAGVRAGYVKGTPEEMKIIEAENAAARKKAEETGGNLAGQAWQTTQQLWHDFWTREGKAQAPAGTAEHGFDPNDPRNPYAKSQGSHQDGIPMVPKTGTYTLHGGEMVLPSADADLLRHSTMEDWKRAISGTESGGAYGIMNSKGSGATGKYQVMPGNIAAWTRAALGYSMSQEQFRNSPMAQERVFETIFGGYVQRFGNPIDAASAWFSGQPFSGNRSGPDAMGTTVPGYIRSFISGLGGSGGRMSVDINDNTGGNVAMAMSQMSMISLPQHPV